MKKRLMLPLLAGFGLAASAPVVIPAAQQAATVDRMVARSVADCSRAAHIPAYTVQLRAVFATQQPAAIAKLDQRGVTICLDERHAAFASGESDRDAMRYLRSWDSFSLPAGSTYADRPRLFNTIVDQSRNTLLERAGHILKSAWNMEGAARQQEQAQREGVRVRAAQAGRTEQGQVAMTVHAMTTSN